MDGAPLPGVDLACNAMYLSLVGESPEMFCPPGCTLQATTQGTIYILDHVRRIGYPLQLPLMPSTTARQPVAAPATTALPAVVASPTPVPYTHPSTNAAQAAVRVDSRTSLPCVAQSHNDEESASWMQAQQPSYKRSRASSADSRTPASSHVSRDRRHRASPEPMLDPTALHALDNSTSRHGERSAPSPTSLSSPGSKDNLSILTSPQFCLIKPHPQWFRSLLDALQVTQSWVDSQRVFIYCYYCRTFFVAKPSAMWQHLSNPKTHRIQRQRVRGYMVSGMHLLNTPEKRLLRVTTPEEIRSVPAKHFQHADRIQRNKGAVFVPACVRYESLLSSDLKQRIVRDGAPFAAKAITREDLLDATPRTFSTEKPQLVGWRFLMEGLDLVECRCSKTDELLKEWTIGDHHKGQ